MNNSAWGVGGIVGPSFMRIIISFVKNIDPNVTAKRIEQGFHNIIGPHYCHEIHFYITRHIDTYAVMFPFT